jgi:predicted molibdopterin-dependent oxidoreductase YjgC
VEACQDLQVNETLSINWEDPHPRVLRDGGSTIGESSCVSCGHCISVCPCNALNQTFTGNRFVSYAIDCYRYHRIAPQTRVRSRTCNPGQYLR